MIPNPIRKVLSSMKESGVRSLLMGGQACVFYGAAEFSRDTDWPMLRRLVEADYFQTSSPTRRRIAFWLKELRTPELLMRLAKEHPALARDILKGRPVLKCAIQGDLSSLEAGLAHEEQSERAKDKLYWAPLLKELEKIRHGMVDMRKVSEANYEE